MKNNCGSLEVLRWTGFLLKEKKIRSSFFSLKYFCHSKKNRSTLSKSALGDEKKSGRHFCCESIGLQNVIRKKQKTKQKKTGSFMIELQKNRIFFSFLFRFLRSILGTEKKRNKNENGGDTFSAVAVAFADELDIIFVSI